MQTERNISYLGRTEGGAGGLFDMGLFREPIRSTPLVPLVRNIDCVRRIKESNRKRRKRGKSGQA